MSDQKRKKKKYETSLLNNKPLGYMMLIPASLMILLISCYPLINGILLSFQNYNLLKPKKQGFAGLANYIKAFSDSEFWGVLGFTFFYTICVVVMAYIVGMVLAMLLNRDIKGRGLFRALALVPWIIPPAVAAVNWSWLFNDQVGLLNTLLKQLPWVNKSILFVAEPQMARFTVIWTSAWKSFPFMMITLLAGLQAIPGELYEAAEIDGASFVHRFRYITIPQLSSVSTVCTTLMFIWTFNNLENIYLLTRGGPNQSTFVLSILTYYTAFMRSDIGYASAISTILLVVLVIVMMFYVRVVDKQAQEV
ncbi:sugar ABC transporter permease [Eubacteriales bacterium OttesenSCG-928-N13]|nr:sugar ABC transporter permease [Eubacteriales bacterium OttesenSCG-928-N13]